MTLTSTSRATLQLLLERGQGLRLAQLLGVDEDQVRERARGALAELAGADPDRNVGLTDYLLGEADPIGRADASTCARTRTTTLAALISERLQARFPHDAELPRLPGEPRRATPTGPRRPGAAR